MSGTSDMANQAHQDMVRRHNEQSFYGGPRGHGGGGGLIGFLIAVAVFVLIVVISVG